MASFLDQLGASFSAGIQGFASGGLAGAVAGVASSFNNPVERRVADRLGVDAARRQVRQIAAPTPVSSVGGLAGGFKPATPVVGTVPVGFRSLIGKAVGRVGKFKTVEQFDKTVGRTKLGLSALAGGVAGAATGFLPEFVLGATQRGAVDISQFTRGGAAVAGAATQVPSGVSATGQLTTGRVSNFAKDACGNVLKFFCSPRPNEGWVQVEDAASLGLRARKPFSRLNLSTGEFERMPRRRMNPLNIKALGRANRRREDFIDICATHLRERRREREGKKPSIKTPRRGKKKR